MHPKLKAFMRTEAMECEVAATQTPPIDTTGGSARLDNPSGPQDMAAAIAATVAAVPGDSLETVTAEAKLPGDAPCHTRETNIEASAAAQGVPKLRRMRSRTSKKIGEDCGGRGGGGNDCDSDDDDEQWCSKGIAVFLAAEDEEGVEGVDGEKGSKDRSQVSESMEVDPASRVEVVEEAADKGDACQEQQQPDTQSKSMLACFKPKNKLCRLPSQFFPPSSRPLGSRLTPRVPSTPLHGFSRPLLPVSLAGSSSVSGQAIRHLFTPSSDVDMDTGEAMMASSPAERTIKTEETKDVIACPPTSHGRPNGCLLGNTPMYAHNPFTMMPNLPLIVKTEPGLSPPCPITHPRHSPVAGQPFMPRVPHQTSALMDYISPIASLPPMEALQCMQIEDLMRMNFVSLSSIKHEHGPRLLSSLHPHGAHHAFYPKPDLLSASKQHPTTHGNNVAKLFTCQQCGATFKHRHHVVRHMRAHTGEKPFRCEECGAMFARKCILTNHIRTHTGEKPYVCGECGDAFSRKHHLVIHRRTHTGEKPYVCTVCATAFARSHHLNRHLKTHILMGQGHLAAALPFLPSEGAIDLSLSPGGKLPADHLPAVDLRLQKALSVEGEKLSTASEDVQTVTEDKPLSHSGQQETIET